MKSILKSVLFLCAFCAAFAANAETWYYDFSKGGAKPIWESTLGTADTAGYWYKLGEDGTTRTYITGTSSYDKLNDTFITKYQTSDPWSANIEFQLSSSSVIEVGSLQLGGTTGRDTRFVGKGKVIVNGDIVRLAEVGSGFFYSSDVYVGGSVIIQGGNLAVDSNALRLEIMGNLSGGGNLFSIVNGKVKARGAADTFELGLANPDLIIHGAVDGVRLLSKADTFNSYYQIGGISNSGAIGREAMANAGTDRNTISYMILTNQNDYTSSAGCAETNNSIWTDKSGKLCIVINGTKSQTFSGVGMGFRGGVKAISGQLYINFNQSNSAGEYTYFRDAAKKILIKAVKNDGDVASKNISFSHGDLEMLGGTFGSAAGSNTYGAFRMTNIKYTNGTIKLRLDSKTQMDSIDLTSYYLCVDDKTSGTSVVSYEKVLGGTLSKQGSDKVTFDFGSNLKWLIDAQDDGVKVVAWDSANKSSLSSDDFSANIFTDTDGEKYSALFAVNDDGLYVKYVQAVPEPATLAALFGALALGFAAWRRRK